MRDEGRTRHFVTASLPYSSSVTGYWSRCFASALILAASGGAWAQGGAANYPNKPVRLVVPFAPGGSSDIVARLIGQKLTEFWGQQFVIDNRPGAGGALGAETVAKAAPDGYTIIFANPGPAVHNVVLRKNPPYRLDDFAPIAYVGYTPNIIVANPKAPFSNLKELVAYAKANPGKINWASPGTGSNPHIALEILKAAAGIEVVHVPYKGAAQAMTDMAAGQVDAQYASIASSEPFIKTGRLKVLGVSGAKRQAVIPYVATFAEQEVQGADSMLWFGFLTAAKTPRVRIDKLNNGVNRALQMPDLRSRLEQLGVEIVGGTPEAFGALIRSEAERLRRLVKGGALQID
jgi:tripartite-type tricarboxylate transporter receptor subunit TctC